jgi:hypothetical protein
MFRLRACLSYSNSSTTIGLVYRSTDVSKEIAD